MNLLALCEQLGRRAQEAANRDEPTFAVPEMSDAVAWISANAPDSGITEDAAVWLTSGASYHALVKLCARAVLALDSLWPPAAPAYRDKVQGELEPMLALWPDTLLLPTPAPLAPLDLIDLRAFPVHPLGLVDRPTWIDGAPRTPSEFLFHDLDHARFKVREDLRLEGIDIADAYQDGSTLDPTTGLHRLIMAHARGKIGARLWARAPSRAAIARRLRATVAALGEGPHRVAAELLLFEVVHEKSFPLDSVVLGRELASDSHLAKLLTKAANGFFPRGMDDAVVAALPAARAALREILI